MIDLHSHILPGIDDGPGDIEASLALAEAAVETGTTVMAATPHLRADHPRVRPEELLGRCREIAGRVAAQGVGLEIVPGGEVDLIWAQEATDEELRLVSYRQAGRDLLIETPYGRLPPRFEDILLAVAARGFRLLLAHPERSPTFQQHPERVAAMVAAGVLMQITASTLSGGGRRPARKLARDMVRDGLAHVIASDAHTTASWRSADLTSGVAAAADLVSARAQWMVTEAPAAVLAGEPLPAPPADPPARPRRGRLRRLRQRPG